MSGSVPIEVCPWFAVESLHFSSREHGGNFLARRGVVADRRFGLPMDWNEAQFGESSYNLAPRPPHIPPIRIQVSHLVEAQFDQ